MFLRTNEVIYLDFFKISKALHATILKVSFIFNRQIKLVMSMGILKQYI